MIYLKIITGSTKLFNIIRGPPNLNSICHRSNCPENGAIVAGAIIAGAYVVTCPVWKSDLRLSDLNLASAFYIVDFLIQISNLSSHLWKFWCEMGLTRLQVQRQLLPNFAHHESKLSLMGQLLSSTVRVMTTTYSPVRQADIGAYYLV